MYFKIFKLRISISLDRTSKNSVPGKYVNERDNDYPDINGHVFELNDDGTMVDMFAMEAGYHNGPRCVLCGDCWCEHCTDMETIEPCQGYKRTFIYKFLSLLIDERKIKPNHCYVELDPRYL